MRGVASAEVSALLSGSGAVGPAVFRPALVGGDQRAVHGRVVYIHARFDGRFGVDSATYIGHVFLYLTPRCICRILHSHHGPGLNRHNVYYTTDPPRL